MTKNDTTTQPTAQTPAQAAAFAQAVAAWYDGDPTPAEAHVFKTALEKDVADFFGAA